MTHNLDDLLTGLAAAPVDTALEGLEPLVWRRVDIFRGIVRGAASADMPP